MATELRRPRLRMVLPACVAVCLLSTATADAATKTAYFDLAGGAPAATKKAVLAAVRKAIKTAGRVGYAARAPIVETATVLGCAIVEPECRALIVGSLGVGELLYGSLEYVAARKYKLSLTLVERGGRILSIASTTVREGRTAEVTRLMAELMKSAGGARSGILSITSEPEGAEMFLAGTRIGVTPLKLTLPVGTHTLDAYLADVALSRTVEVVGGVTEAHFDLTRLAGTPLGPSGRPEPIVDRTGSRPGAVIAGVVLVGAGVAMTAVGVGHAVTGGSIHTELDEGLAGLSAPPTAADVMTLAELEQLASKGKTRGAIAATSLTVGGAAIVAGAVITIVSLAGGGGSSSSADTTGPAVTVSPIGPGGPGASITVRW